MLESGSARTPRVTSVFQPWAEPGGVDPGSGWRSDALVADGGCVVPIPTRPLLQEGERLRRRRTADKRTESLLRKSRKAVAIEPQHLVDPATGRKVVPDALTPSGRPVELKPNTPSGRRAGKKQRNMNGQPVGRVGLYITARKVGEMESLLAKRISGILGSGLTPLLRAHEFRKCGQVYVSERGDVSWVVHVQRSRWNDETEAQFTINEGIYTPGVVGAYLGRPEPSALKLVDCCLSVRIGCSVNQVRQVVESRCVRRS